MGDTRGNRSTLARWNGNSWASLGPNNNNNLTAIDCIGSGNCIAVGNNGTIWHLNPDNSLTPEQSNTNEDLTSISCAWNQDTQSHQCWAVGDHGTILRRNATGLWTVIRISNDLSSQRIRCMTSARCIIAGNRGTLFEYNNTTQPASLNTFGTNNNNLNYTALSTPDLNTVWWHTDSMVKAQPCVIRAAIQVGKPIAVHR